MDVALKVINWNIKTIEPIQLLVVLVIEAIIISEIVGKYSDNVRNH